MITKEQFEEKLENSLKSLKTALSGKQLTKLEIANRIQKVLEKENKDIQTITQLKYLEGLSVSEISKVVNKSESDIFAYLSYIISRINSVIMFEEKENKENKENTDNKDNEEESKVIGSILDIKG